MKHKLALILVLALLSACSSTNEIIEEEFNNSNNTVGLVSSNDTDKKAIWTVEVPLPLCDDVKVQSFCVATCINDDYADPDTQGCIEHCLRTGEVTDSLGDVFADLTSVCTMKQGVVDETK